MIKQILIMSAILIGCACDRPQSMPVIPDEVQDCACEYYRQRGDAKLVETYCAIREVVSP
jgi:hypothetical protein